MNQLYFAMATVQAFFSDRLDNRKDRGATAVEYGLMVGLIAVAIIVAVVFLGDKLTDIFAGTGNKVAGVTSDANLNTQVPGK
ncbi:Flp family type IVb pilin [uncultured Dietzia sp.]|uniref:Flp family type IVb pilin n=1 Tax=uncultured Dietzia sp. TaxID=395519 RepID=UPI0025E6E64D|nr:Flp family type IVb pilin [uncultured Dietzia sp.]